MKKVLLVCAFLVGLSAVSFAQGGRGQQRTPDEQVTALKAAVTGITDDQAAKIKAVYVASTKSTDSLRAAPGFDPQASRPAMMAIRTAATAKINAILTPDQQKVFATMAPAGRGGRGGQGGGNGGGAPATPPAGGAK